VTILSKDIHLNEQNYQNLLQLMNKHSDFALIYSEEEQCYLLFIHGTKLGYVIMNSNYITLTEIGQTLETLKYNVCIKVICCYGAYQATYETDNVSVKPYISNEDVMYFKPFEHNGEKYCNIHCSV